MYAIDTFEHAAGLVWGHCQQAGEYEWIGKIWLNRSLRVSTWLWRGQVREDFPDINDEEFRYLLACTVYLRTERDPAEANRRLIRTMAVHAALTITSNVERDAYFLDPERDFI